MFNNVAVAAKYAIREHGLKRANNKPRSSRVFLSPLKFNPELVIISAGFDSAKGDLLGDCCVTPAGYQHITSLLRNLAGGKLILQLEVSPFHGTPALASIERARTAVKPYWKCLTPEDTPIVVEPEKPIESVSTSVKRLNQGEVL
ncbi:histone deacetylase, putative [Ixodes scapularis]|uniref:histone deacetylase n=1 Tax=Ixodes scapularis TaxID=6945 RepID=B7Q088_IXOSC|nr:histone deacetylase, putative [Ixodes scapularis]|eukprot:XP_002407215.1 histone deacetylase, putative [Ixodes scapularis]